MKWPEKPTCHGGGEWSVWKEPRRDDEPYGEPYRTCAYCGSIHPEGLVQALQSGARLEETDQKYGWPHKFYVHGIPNLHRGKLVRVGSRHAPGQPEEIITGLAPDECFAKWYNDHFLDDGYDEEALARLQELVSQYSGVHFVIRGGRLAYHRWS